MQDLSTRLFHLYTLCLLSWLVSFPEGAQANTLGGAPVGLQVEVIEGQEFYAEDFIEPVSAYRLVHPFKSSMAGSMGMSFAFAIDSDLLLSVRKDAAGWEYFVPLDHKFRAYHSLLGSVIRGHDTVGLRVEPHGQMEWFVDNSIYFKSPKIWTRRVRPDDPPLTRVEFASGGTTGDSVKRLIYLGVTEDNRAKIRLEKITPRETTRDEFRFFLNNKGVGIGDINGVEFIIHSTPSRAIITILKAATAKSDKIAPNR